MKNLDYFFDDLPDLMPEISDYLDNYNLCDAVVMSDELRVRALLDRGESPNQTNSHGTTALELAVENWDPEIITLLIKAGVNLDAKFRSGATLLHMAASESCTDICKLLLSKGMDINAQTCHGHTPLRFAISSPETLKFLLQKGANPNIRDKRFKKLGYHLVSIPSKRNIKALCYMAMKGCDLDFFSSFSRLRAKNIKSFLLHNFPGWTPLHNKILFHEDISFTEKEIKHIYKYRGQNLLSMLPVLALASNNNWALKKMVDDGLKIKKLNYDLAEAARYIKKPHMINFIKDISSNNGSKRKRDQADKENKEDESKINLSIKQSQ
ncbi:MAG: ankyrin repeat domain-containing protein [Pseudomonadota bacterium]|nr:ankyrin repeat domain-containing protein [Pseudomonadota bacterium]